MSNPEIVAHLGRMVRAERARLGYASIEQAAEMAGMKTYKTLNQFELGHTMPYAANRSKIENLLMWRDGSLTEALTKDPGEVSFDFMRDWEKEEPASSASELTDESLITEMIKRLEGWRMKLARLDELEAAQTERDGVVLAEKIGLDASVFEGRGTPAQQSPAELYNLAAHAPRSGKPVDPRKATRK